MTHLDLFAYVASFSGVTITAAPNAAVSRAFDNAEATNASLTELSFTIGESDAVVGIQFRAMRQIMDDEGINSSRVIPGLLMNFVCGAHLLLNIYKEIFR